MHLFVDLGQDVERIGMEVAVEAVVSEYTKASERLNLGQFDRLLRFREAPGALHQAKSLGSCKSLLDEENDIPENCCIKIV